MKRELENELEPLNINQPGCWDKAVRELSENPGKVLPVFLEHPTTGQEVGHYFISFIREGEKTFVQAEGFDSMAIEKGFVVGSTSEWKKLQPGIYRLDITKEAGQNFIPNSI